MLCKKPYMVGVLPCGCGQCLPCRINRRRLWRDRMLLESVNHAGSCFVTLTYSEKHLPLGASLVPSDCRNWLKRLRKAVWPVKLRYFLVGEYGEVHERPHYHAAIFGLEQLVGGGLDGISGVVANSWGLGNTLVGDLSSESAAYIAKYVTKKMTGFADERLLGRHPEFARMSLRPGIGARAMADVAAALCGDVKSRYFAGHVDVPFELKIGGRSVFIGRYLRRELRKALGFDVETPEAAAKEFGLKMRVLLEEGFKIYPKAASLSNLVVDLNSQKCANLIGRWKVLESRGRKI